MNHIFVVINEDGVIEDPMNDRDATVHIFDRRLLKDDCENFDIFEKADLPPNILHWCAYKWMNGDTIDDIIGFIIQRLGRQHVS